MELLSECECDAQLIDGDAPRKRVSLLKREVTSSTSKKARREQTDVGEGVSGVISWGEDDEAFLAEVIRQEEERERNEKKGTAKENEKVEEKEIKGDFVLEERKGDLFTAGEEYCLAHCVSEDLVMGKGVAKPFKEKFGGINELRAQRPQTGGVCVLKRGSRWIYYLITKVTTQRTIPPPPLSTLTLHNHNKVVYKNRPTYNALKDSLQAMKAHMLRV